MLSCTKFKKSASNSRKCVMFLSNSGILIFVSSGCATETVDSLLIALWKIESCVLFSTNELLIIIYFSFINFFGCFTHIHNEEFIFSNSNFSTVNSAKALSIVEINNFTHHSDLKMIFDCSLCLDEWLFNQPPFFHQRGGTVQFNGHYSSRETQ